nr:hypothetical protein [Morchella crassipes]
MPPSFINFHYIILLYNESKFSTAPRGRGGEWPLKIIKWPLPPLPPLNSFILIFSPALPYHNLDYENNPCLKGKGDLEKTCLFLRHALVERSSTNVKKNNKSPPFPR